MDSMKDQKIHCFIKVQNIEWRTTYPLKYNWSKKNRFDYIKAEESYSLVVTAADTFNMPHDSILSRLKTRNTRKEKKKELM